MSKQQYEAFTTPAGVAVFPWISAPDTKFNANGVYKTDISVPIEIAQEFIDKLEAARTSFIETLPAHKQKTLIPRPVYKVELTRPEYPEDATKEEKKAIRDEWEGEETGNVLFTVKMKANVPLKDGKSFSQEPTVVDDNGDPVTEPVFDGSIIKVKGQIVPYTNDAAGTVGVTLRMKAVQVLELVTGDGEGAGFWTDFNADE